MRSKFTLPAIVRLPIDDRDWIEVKRELNAGETIAMYASYSAGRLDERAWDRYRRGQAVVWKDTLISVITAIGRADPIGVLPKEALEPGELEIERALRHAFDAGTQGRRADYEGAGKAEVIAYLVDWNYTDAGGKPVRIDTEERKLAALDALTPAAFQQIAHAITAHIERVELENLEKKSGDSSSSESTSS